MDDGFDTLGLAAAAPVAVFVAPVFAVGGAFCATGLDGSLLAAVFCGGFFGRGTVLFTALLVGFDDDDGGGGLLVLEGALGFFVVADIRVGLLAGFCLVGPVLADGVVDGAAMEGFAGGLFCVVGGLADGGAGADFCADEVVALDFVLVGVSVDLGF